MTFRQKRVEKKENLFDVNRGKELDKIIVPKGWKKSPFTVFGEGWRSKDERTEIYVNNEEGIGKPRSGQWYVSISRLMKRKKIKWFKTKSQAMVYAKNYMAGIKKI